MSLNIEIQRNTPISNFNKPNSSLNRRHLVGPVFICSLYILKFDVYFEVRYTVKLIFSPFRTQNRAPKYTFYTRPFQGGLLRDDRWYIVVCVVVVVLVLFCRVICSSCVSSLGSGWGVFLLNS